MENFEETKKEASTFARNAAFFADKFLKRIATAESPLDVYVLTKELSYQLRSNARELVDMVDDRDVIGHVAILKAEQKLYVNDNKNHLVCDYMDTRFQNAQSYGSRQRGYYLIPTGTPVIVSSLDQYGSANIGVSLIHEKKRRILLCTAMMVSGDQLDFNVPQPIKNKYAKAVSRFLLKRGFDNLSMMERMQEKA